MRFARYHHTATTLPDGRVLVTGGDRGEDDFQRSAEIYDPARNRWTRAPSMRRARGNHSATLLPDGRVLVAGGGARTPGFTKGAETYDAAHEPLAPRRAT